MLWTLLIALNSAMFVAGFIAWFVVLRSPQLLTNIAAAVVITTIASANAWAWSILANAIDVRLRGLSDSMVERRLRWVYILAGLWIPIAGFLGFWIPKGIAYIL